ncbi:MAG: hypothetical protein IJN42_03440 [Clostridia bacterium]|nr:hypothetical protein [Clostridia bacterium]
MKKRTALFTLIVIMVLCLTACKQLDVSINSVGKNNTSAKKIVAEIEKDLLAEDPKNPFVLYGLEMSMDIEGIGKTKLYYTDKLPQDLKYSDITVITVDTRTGHIDSVDAADFVSLETTPYEFIVDGAPAMLSDWAKDSDEARKIAENTFYGEENFVYNYVKISAFVKNGIRQYEVTFISFVNQLQYICRIDGMTGNVIFTDITKL